MNDCTPILPGLSSVCGLDIHARFDGGQMSSNGGALLLREAGRGFKFGGMLAGCIGWEVCGGLDNRLFNSLVNAVKPGTRNRRSRNQRRRMKPADNFFDNRRLSKDEFIFIERANAVCDHPYPARAKADQDICDVRLSC